MRSIKLVNAHVTMIIAGATMVHHSGTPAELNVGLRKPSCARENLRSFCSASMYKCHEVLEPSTPQCQGFRKLPQEGVVCLKVISKDTPAEVEPSTNFSSTHDCNSHAASSALRPGTLPHRRKYFLGMAFPCSL